MLPSGDHLQGATEAVEDTGCLSFLSAGVQSHASSPNHQAILLLIVKNNKNPGVITEA